MNLDKNLICGLSAPVEGEDLPPADRLRLAQSCGHSYSDKYARVLEYIVSHHTHYNKLPDLETLENEFPALDFEPNPEPYRYYVQKAQEFRQRRHIQEQIARMESGLSSDGDLREAIHAFVDSAREFEASTIAGHDVLVREESDRFIEDYLRRKESGLVEGLTTGFDALDQGTFGIQPGDFWLVTGRPGTFKSWILCYMALSGAYKSDRPVLFFSKEMTKVQIQMRLMALAGHVSFTDIRRYRLDEGALRSIQEKMNRMISSDLVLIGKDTKQAYDPVYVHSKILEYDPVASYIDGLYFMAQGEDWKDHTQLTRAIRDTALNTNSSVIATVQRRKDNKEIAYSDSYQQDASVVLRVDRIKDTVLNKLTNTVRIISDKVRDDPPDIKFRVGVDFDNSTFGDPDMADGASWSTSYFGEGR